MPSKAIQSVMTENGWDEETAVYEVLKSLGFAGEKQELLELFQTFPSSEKNDEGLVKMSKQVERDRKRRENKKAVEEHKKKKREEHHYKGDAFQNGKYSFSAQGHNGTIEILKRSKTGFLTIKINDAEKTIRRRPKAGLNWFYIPVWNGVCDVDVEINTFNITKL